MKRRRSNENRLTWGIGLPLTLIVLVIAANGAAGELLTTGLADDERIQVWIALVSALFSIIGIVIAVYAVNMAERGLDETSQQTRALQLEVGTNLLVDIQLLSDQAIVALNECGERFTPAVWRGQGANEWRAKIVNTASGLDRLGASSRVLENEALADAWNAISHALRLGTGVQDASFGSESDVDAMEPPRPGTDHAECWDALVNAVRRVGVSRSMDAVAAADIEQEPYSWRTWMLLLEGAVQDCTAATKATTQAALFIA